MTMELKFIRNTGTLVIRAMLDVNPRASINGMSGQVFTASEIKAANGKHFLDKYYKTGVIQFDKGYAPLTGDESKQIDKMQDEYKVANAEIIATRKENARKAREYQRGVNEGGEGYNPFCQ